MYFPGWEDYQENTKYRLIKTSNQFRTTPLEFHYHSKKQQQKLEELVEQEVIAWVTEPTPWISNIVVIRKPHKLRICIDPYHLNKAIQRNHYPTPTVEEIATKTGKARLFSFVDAKDGFLQVALDESSSYLTTCWTPFGRIRWLRMPFGISSALEEWQRRLDHSFEGLDNTQVIADDTIIYGSGENDAEADKSHDTAFRALIERCREKGLKLNTKKLNFKQTSVSYMGDIFSAQGLAADPEKVKAVSQMQCPTDVQGVQRVLGVANNLAKFTPKQSAVCEPLRRLLDKDSVFDWLPQQEAAFSRMKELITQAPVLQYDDVKKEVSLECDSSEVGLGAVIKQGGHPIAYASRSLTKTERNYAQIEKECLAIVFAAERFGQCILGKEKVKVFSDHKPLETILSNPIHTSPKRQQRMRLRLQKYSLDVEDHSDTLSRASLPPTETAREDKAAIFEIHELMEKFELEDHHFVSDHRLARIKEKTGQDTTLLALIEITKKGWPVDKNDSPLNIREYWPYRNELATENGHAYRGTRLIIPTKLRPEMVVRVHRYHLGIQYTLNTAREIMFWPRMHAEITEAVRRCETCQLAQPQQQRQPLMSYPIPSHPWQLVASDCFEINGRQYVVLVDICSDFIELGQLEGDPKAPFSIATTPRCRGGRYTFPTLLQFTFDTYLIMLSVKQGGIKYLF